MELVWGSRFGLERESLLPIRITAGLCTGSGVADGLLKRERGHYDMAGCNYACLHVINMYQRETHILALDNK